MSRNYEQEILGELQAITNTLEAISNSGARIDEEFPASLTATAAALRAAGLDERQITAALLSLCGVRITGADLRFAVPLGLL